MIVSEPNFGILILIQNFFLIYEPIYVNGSRYIILLVNVFTGKSLNYLNSELSQKISKTTTGRDRRIHRSSE